MKNMIITVLMLFVASSCGNPHVSSSRGGLERTNPPLINPQVEDPECKSFQDLTEYQFYFGSAADAETGTQAAPLRKISRCGEHTQEDFNDHREGSVTTVNGHDFEITHQNENTPAHEKVIYLEDIFGTMTYSFLIQSPVTQGSASGKDHGVNSLSEDAGKDALVWSFHSPIKYWSAKVVSLSSRARIRTFNCNRELIEEKFITYPNNETGKNELHHVGFISPVKNVCYVSVSASDGASAVAVDEFFFGR